MDDTKPMSLEQMRAFVAAGGSAEFQVEDRAEKYACVERTLRHLDYPQLGRADKGLVKQYLSKLTGLCRAQPSASVESPILPDGVGTCASTRCTQGDRDGVNLK